LVYLILLYTHVKILRGAERRGDAARQRDEIWHTYVLGSSGACKVM